MDNWIINPVYLKKSLAKIIITLIYDEDSANNAENEFNGIYGKEKKYWELDLPEKSVLDDSIKLVELISQQFGMSKSEIRRLADAWAINIILKDNSVRKVDSQGLMDEIWLINEDMFIIKIWKKKIFKVKIAS